MQDNRPDAKPADSFIRFACTFCGQKIRVTAAHAGKKVKCPKCKNAIVVPETQIIADLLTPNPAVDTGEAKEKSPLTFLDTPQKARPATEPTDTAERYGDSDPALQDQNMLLLGYRRSEPKPPPERKLFWVIDIFLYPTSPLSLALIALCLTVPLIVRILLLASGPFILITFWFGWIIVIMLYVYAFWYFSTSIRQSAEGQLRAPSAVTDVPGLREMFGQLFRAIVCLLFFFLPMIVYYRRTQTIDTVFWLLFGLGVFLFPMGLLAIIVLDSFTGLNPIFLIGSISSAFLPYCCLVAIYFGLGWLLVRIGPLWKESRELAYISIAGIFYLLLVAGHLLGRFFFRYQEKLNWNL